MWFCFCIFEKVKNRHTIFKNLKNIDPAASLIVEYWVNWLQNKFSSAVTDFDFYNVMIQAQKRIDQVPNFYMKKQVYYNREHSIVETLYKSEREEKIRRYLLHLPADFSKEKKYAALVFLHDVRNNEEESARKIGNLLAKYGKFLQKKLLLKELLAKERFIT